MDNKRKKKNGKHVLNCKAELKLLKDKDIIEM